jgi:hypothetical protein
VAQATPKRPPRANQANNGSSLFPERGYNNIGNFITFTDEAFK